MCGRFTNRYSWKQLHRLLSLTTPVPESDVVARFNIAPTQNALIVRQDTRGNRAADQLRWGLVPFWADDPAIGNRLINARSEEAATKPSFRAAFKKRRCLIPVSDFYEWQAIPGEKRKQPWAFRVAGAPLFAFAGLWERWSKADVPLDTFTILTGAPNTLLAPIHNRMPVIVRPSLYDLWLDPARETPSDLAPVFEPFPADQMEAHRVGTRVNSPLHDDPACIQPIDL